MWVASRRSLPDVTSTTVEALQEMAEKIQGEFIEMAGGVGYISFDSGVLTKGGAHHWLWLWLMLLCR